MIKQIEFEENFDNKKVWVEYDEVDFLQLQDRTLYQQDMDSLNIFFESIELFLIKNKKNILFFIVFSGGLVLLLRGNHVLAKEITKDFINDNQLPSSFPFKVYDFRPVPVKIVPKKVIQNIQKIPETDITISVNILDFFKKPPLKVIEEVKPNLTELVLKSTTAGAGAGLGLGLALRGGSVIGWASSFAIKKLLRILKPENKQDPSVDKFLESVFLKEDNSPEKKKLPVKSSKSNFAQQSWFALINPKVGGPFVTAILIFLVYDHFQTDQENKGKWGGKKRVSVAETLNIPLPLPKQKKKNIFQKSVDNFNGVLVWNLAHPQWLLLICLMFIYRNKVGKFFVEGDFRNTVVNRFFDSLAINLETMKDSLNRAQEIMGRFNAEIFAALRASHINTEGRLVYTEKQIEELRQRLELKNEEFHDVKFKGAYLLNQLSLCENVNQFNMDLVNKLSGYNNDLNNKIHSLGSTSNSDVSLDFSNKQVQQLEPKPFILTSNMTELNTFFEKKEKMNETPPKKR